MSNTGSFCSSMNRVIFPSFYNCYDNICSLNVFMQYNNQSRNWRLYVYAHSIRRSHGRTFNDLEKYDLCAKCSATESYESIFTLCFFSLHRYKEKRTIARSRLDIRDRPTTVFLYSSVMLITIWIYNEFRFYGLVHWNVQFEANQWLVTHVLDSSAKKLLPYRLEEVVKAVCISSGCTEAAGSSNYKRCTTEAYAASVALEYYMLPSTWWSPFITNKLLLLDHS